MDMNPPANSNSLPAIAPQTCWKQIGVWGDSSCEELKAAVHCRNCSIFSSTASKLLDIDVPLDYLDQWTSHYSTRKLQADPTAVGVLLFRLGSEWFGMKSHTLQEITELRPIHSIPHSAPVAMGLTNIRGILMIAVNLASLLGLPSIAFSKLKHHNESASVNDLKPARTLVVSHNCKPLAFPVNEVGGIHKFGLHQLKTPPVTVTNSMNAFTHQVFEWQDKVVGLLDEELLFYTIQKRLS
ncbi:MAG: chemotaxis protein CheW [Verrucomicrobiales bacterium]